MQSVNINIYKLTIQIDSFKSVEFFLIKYAIKDFNISVVYN